MVQILKEPLESRLTYRLHQDALAYWRRLRGAGDALPGRQDVDPLDIPDLLPWVNLVEVHGGPHDGPAKPRFRHRLVGTGIVDMTDSDGTGRWLHDMLRTERMAQVGRMLEAVARTREPELMLDDLGGDGPRLWSPSSLVLPLAADRRDVDMLMLVTQYG